MRMYDIIIKKRNSLELNDEEIKFFIDGCVNDEIPDYQISALLMAIYFNGMSIEETSYLTMCMANSGDIMDLSSISGVKVDKHSTGGVGDKTSLIILPIVASLGVKVAKMSGRGLGFTGGTIDKLESIPGFKTNLSKQNFLEIVNNIGISIISQSGNLVPADKKLYALRDVTATVESMPLIASSIMSKKIAAGSDCILLDVKVGNGAFVKNIDNAIKLAQFMVNIGENNGKKTVALITNMDSPLGKAIGNSLEIKEVCNVLRGNGPKDLRNICIELSANILCLSGLDTIENCKEKVINSLDIGLAFNKFIELVQHQGGDVSVIKDNSKFLSAPVKYCVKSDFKGFINVINAEKCGLASMMLGAGRETKNSVIDHSAGILLNKSVGDEVKLGDIIATLYSDNILKCKSAEKLFLSSIDVIDKKPINRSLVLARVTKNSITMF